jgi:hypothetical protein
VSRRLAQTQRNRGRGAAEHIAGAKRRSRGLVAERHRILDRLRDRRTVRSREQLDALYEAFVMHRRRRSTELEPELVRLGVEFADGRKATNLGHPFHRDPQDEDRSQPVLPRGGGGGGRSWQMTWWVWPLPPPGQLALVCEWRFGSVLAANTSTHARRSCGAPSSSRLHGSRTPAPASLPASLPAHLLGFLIGHVEDDRAFASVVEADRPLRTVAILNLSTGEIGDENALSGHYSTSSIGEVCPPLGEV